MQARTRVSRLPGRAMSQSNDVKPLNEHALRVLARIAALMESGFTGRVELEFSQGGVRTMREGRNWTPAELPEPNERYS